MDETFGPEYVRPAQLNCSRCGCCTAALCEKGWNSFLRCFGHVGDEFRYAVHGCPCSAEMTKHTASWRMAQVRVTRMARELPIVLEAKTLLRGLVAGSNTEDAEGVFPQLRLRGLGQLVHGLPAAITALGHTYLAARDDVRATTAVRVVDVGKEARTVLVEVAAWRPDEPVPVLLDQITSDSGLDVDSLPDRWLTADANCHAEHTDCLVLTAFRPSGPLPQGRMPASGGDVE